MSIKNTILFFLKSINLIGKERLYIKQPLDSSICFPIALHNMLVYLDKAPPSLRKLKKICNSSDTGTILEDLPVQLLEDKFGLKSSMHSSQILKKGGLLYIKNSEESSAHVVFCHPNKNKRFNLINFGSNEDKILSASYEGLKKHFVNFKSGRGFYLK